MRLHRRDDDAFRQPQEPLVERAGQDERRFDEIDDLVQLPQRVAPLAEGVQPGHDLLEADRAVWLDTDGAQDLEVAVRGRDLDRPG